jgi:putative ABC transport system substrate-binding protein
VDRRRFLLTSLAGVLAASLAAGAQHTPKTYKVGILDPVGDAVATQLWTQIFPVEMTALGYAVGQTIVFDYRSSRGRDELLTKLAAELVALDVDVIATAAGGTQSAMQATRRIPIIFFTQLNPVAAGVVASLAHPGGNVTGFSEQSDELSAKRLDLLKEAVPGVSRVAVLMGVPSAYLTSAAADLPRTQRAGQLLGLSVKAVEFGGADDVEMAFATIVRDRADALLILPSGHLTYLHRRQIADAALKRRVPTMYAWKEGAHAGALMSYGVDFVDLWRRAARYVDISKHVGRVNRESIVIDAVAA